MFFIHVIRIYISSTNHIYHPSVQKMFIEGAAIAIVYFIIRFIDMRFVSGETAPLKVIVQNVLSVYASAIIGLYTLKQFNQTALKGKQNDSEGATPVFTAAPGF